MDGAEILRAARRRQGWSQRALAARSGVAKSTVAAVEAGRRSPSFDVVTAVLAAAGLELALDVAVPQLDDATVHHLHLSLGSRLHLACGGDGRPDRPARPPERRVPSWEALLTLAARHVVHLHGATARALWLPPRSSSPVAACVHDRAADGSLRRTAHPEIDPTLVALRTDCPGHPPPAVTVRLGWWDVTVDPPGELALQPEHCEHRAVLRAVARRLHAQAPVDARGRRPRAHRDPHHMLERDEVFHTKRFAAHPMPSRTDVRSWRLDDDASLAAWLRRQGMPA